MKMIQGISIRPMAPSDVPAGVALCRAARWNQTEHDWQYMLANAPNGAVVAVADDVVIGTAATVPYGVFTWISMVLVNPAFRSRGVGTLLLERGLDLIPESVVARLDATPAGEPLYRKLGFEAEYGLGRWFIEATGGSRCGGGRYGARAQASTAPEARLLTPTDWPGILQMDRHVFGASRERLLNRLAGEAPEYGWILGGDGRTRAYLLGRHGHVRDQLGPLVADNAESARVLLESCLAANADRRFFIDVPDGRAEWTATLHTLGFAIERPFLRMYRGNLTAPGNPSVVYAVTGPEFG
jgi:GNAT superfamily N-acetyltransferase